MTADPTLLDIHFPITDWFFCFVFFFNAKFWSLRWFRFDCFVLVVSLVLLVSVVSFRSFRFAVSGFSTCQISVIK